jgi:hypothetical protein
VLENQQPGTPMSTWAINGNINNQGNDSAIEGFATSISVSPGQTENFKINTNSTSYKVDIYRLGYYGGNGARLISSQTVQLSSSQVQPTPLFDPSTNQVDAGNWAVSASWAVPSNAVSGVYFAKLTTLNGTKGQNMIPFVVTNGGAGSDIKFQTSDATWEAYNPWGGYNLYTGPDQSSSDRAFAVSYNRPIDVNSTNNVAGPQDFLFGEEYPAIYWLEENGYNVSYISSVDAANNPSALANTKVYMDVGHDEYWSQSQYNNVQAAAHSGVNLAFLSGNQVYWDVAYTNGLSGSPNTTIVEYKDPWAGAQIDPNGTSGGGGSTFRDPNFGPDLPENSLSGNIFQVDDLGSLANVEIPYSLSQFHFWRNTGVASLAPGSVAALTNLLGYEWDTDNNNGFRPAGVVDLSSTTDYVGTLLLDYGRTVGAGSATHSLTLYRDQTSGALIFSAGTVMWSWGLDTQHALFHGLTAPVSQAVQQSLVNLFADMGVQPQTLMASLFAASGSTDTTPPVSQITSIGSGSSPVSDQPVTISGTATDSASKVAMVEISTDGGNTWNRATGFGSWAYSWIPPAAGTYTIETRATDDVANLEKPSDAQSVTVSAGSTASLFTSAPGDVIRNSVVSDVVNSDDPNPVELGIQFTASTSGTISGIRFYKDVNDTGTHVGSLWTSSGTLLASGTFTNETASGWQTLTFTTPVAITAGTNYIAGYHSNGFYPADSNYFTAPLQNGPLSAVATGGGPSFFTYSSTSVFPTSSGNNENYWVDVVFSPSGSGGGPVAGDVTGLSATENTVLSVPASTLLAKDSSPQGYTLTVTGVTNPPNGTTTYNASTQTVTFTPSTGYTGPDNFTYTISDGHGGTATGNVDVTVTYPKTAQSLFYSSDTPAVTNDSDASAVELGVKFTSDVNGTVTGIRFYKGSQNTGTHQADLWSASGALLATATFTNESASGWEQVNFSSPVSITAGTTYIAAYHTNTGHYADTSNYFTASHTNGDLTAPASGNDVYAYSSSDAFPTNTFSASNYWVDLVFNAGGTSAPLSFTSPASITGTAREGSVLTAVNGTINDPNAVISGYQWQSSGGNGTTWSNITGATTATYTPVEADETHLLRVVETATDTGSSQSGTSASAATAAVADVVLAFTSAASISGAATVGSVLTAANGALNDADAAVTGYQWQSSSNNGSTWSNITGATSTTYTPVAADAGNVLRVVETATDVDGGPSTTSNSLATAAIAAGAPTGFTFAPATSSLQTLQGGGSNLSAGTPVGTFTQTGGVAGDSFTYTFSGSTAFSLSSSSNQGTLSTGGNAVAANTVAALSVQVNDVSNGTHSGPLPFDIVVGSSGADTINLSTLGIAPITPTLVYGLAGNDTLNGSGMSGQMWFIGGAAADTMTGGTGPNTYLYAATGDSTPAAFDIITNFNTALDKIDLTGTGTTALSFLATQVSTRIPGRSIGWQQSGGNTFFYVNTSNSSKSLGSANMEVQLNHSISLTAADFLHH